MDRPGLTLRILTWGVFVERIGGRGAGGGQEENRDRRAILEGGTQHLSVGAAYDASGALEGAAQGVEADGV